MSTREIRPCGCAGKGRHKNACPENKFAAPSLVAESVEPKAKQELWHGFPIAADDWLEQYGGDLAALDAWSPRARRPLARWNDYQPTGTTLPDLNPQGMLVLRDAPEQKFHFTYLDEDGSPYSRQVFITMRRLGYRPVTVGEFFIHSSLRDFLVPEDGTGRLTLGASKGGVTVIYCQGQSDYRRAQTIKFQQSDEIQKTAEQRATDLQSGMNRDGFHGLTSSAEMTDDLEAAREFNR